MAEHHLKIFIFSEILHLLPSLITEIVWVEAQCGEMYLVGFLATMVRAY